MRSGESDVSAFTFSSLPASSFSTSARDRGAGGAALAYVGMRNDGSAANEVGCGTAQIMRNTTNAQHVCPMIRLRIGATFLPSGRTESPARPADRLASRASDSAGEALF